MGKMTIEETYKGMWSSDPSLLKSLVDAGNTIIVKIITKDEQLRAVKADENCFIDLNSGTRFGRQMASTKDFSDMAGRLGIMFLVPPRPLVLEPKPLEWEFQEESENNIARFITNQWPWHFHVSKYGSHWAIYFEHDCLKSGSCEDAESAKAAIQEWRVNHLKSMLP